MTRAATYARKSNVDKARAGKSVRDQLKDAAAEVNRRGWQLVGEFSDDGISASRHARNRARPGFDQVLAMIEAREIDAVVMAEQSRATRSLAVLGALLETCADAEVLLVVGGTEIDPTKPEGFLMAGVQGSVDATESERTRQRTLRGLRHAAAEGKPTGRTPFGYLRRYDPNTRALISQDINEAEAALVRRLVAGILAGRSLRSLCLELDAEGVRTPAAFRNPDATMRSRTTGEPIAVKGTRWSQSHIRRLVLTPTIAGLRVHQGEVVGPGNWEPIVPPEDWQAVVRILSDPSRSTVRPGALRHLLSGVAVCGECRAPMRTRTNRGRYHSYTCVEPGCMRVVIKQEWVDEYVTAAVLEYLRSPLFGEAINAASSGAYADARAHIANLRDRQAEIGAAIASGSLSLAAGQAADRAAAEQIAEAEDQMRAAASGSPALAEFAAGDPETLWADLETAQRAAVIRAVVTPVIHRTGVPSKTFNPDRITLEWTR